MIADEVLAKFKEIYGEDGDIRVYFAPGRVYGSLLGNEVPNFSNGNKQAPGCQSTPGGLLRI